MKRVVVATLLVSAAALAGCENSTSAVYDPSYDGVTSLEKPHPDLTILEDQKKLYEKLAAVTPAGAHPASAPAAPGAAPA